MKKLLTTVILILSFTLSAYSQDLLEKTLRGYTRPDELVSMSPSLPFNQAVALMSKVSESITGKRIVSTVDSENPIGIEIKNMAYDKALLILVQMQGLIYEEKEDVIVIKKKNNIEIDKTAKTYADINSREVKLSAVFFEMNNDEAKKRGIDWQFLFSKKGLDVNGDLFNEPETKKETSGDGTQVETPDFKLKGTGNFDLGGFFGQATAIFKFFEQQQLGQIIASPNVTVRDNQKGRIQVGTDIGIKTRDFSGNIIEEFYSTGTIIEVTPHVYTEDGVDYTVLEIKAEKSSYIPDPTITQISKTSATTQVLMLNGEEVIIGGLFTNEETTSRKGIPILKDLPWWFFGLRYVFGSDEITVNRKELIILLKCELVPTLKERVAGTPTTTPIKDEVNKQREQIKYYRFNQENSEN
ncbi:MAG TPA: type II and III secretion system protein [Ignavibacteriaceae bacterium]|nr:type II and III secretion system protein [Ignavibacteriaceae bacterium]